MTTAATPPSPAPVTQRTSPELSDIALFVMAVAAVIVVRRALRARFARQRQHDRPKD